MAKGKKGRVAEGKGEKPKAKKQLEDLDPKDGKNVKGGVRSRRY